MNSILEDTLEARREFFRWISFNAFILFATTVAMGIMVGVIFPPPDGVPSTFLSSLLTGLFFGTITCFILSSGAGPAGKTEVTE